jgi:transcriptional regulator with XRE-family HTH domain
MTGLLSIVMSRCKQGLLTSRSLRRLDQYRLENDLTYRQLAEKIGGLTHAGLFNLLRGKSGPPRDRTAYRIKKFLAEQVSL